MTSSKVRQQRILKNGSPYYNVDVGVLAAGASVQFDTEAISADARKYQPLDFLEVTNISATVPVRVTLDGSDSFLVPAAMVRTIEDHPYRMLRVTNEHAANALAAGDCTLLCQRAAIKVDTFIRRFVR